MRKGVTGVAAMAIGLGLIGAGGARGEEGAKTARASIYDAKADARKQVETASAIAKKDGKRVLLMFGGDWCGWCHKLHGLFKTDREITSLLANEYALVMIDTEAPNAEGLLKETSKGQERVGFPFLAVLDADGKLLVGQKTDPLEVGDHHDPAKVKAFLEQWRVPPADAERLLADALVKAKAGGQRVILDFGAPWCGWCHRLDAYFARAEVAEALADSFLVQKIDIERTTHGAEVMKRYRKDDSGGIPWYVVLDGEGKPHGTADADFGNIGYPMEPKEIDAFLKLLESQGKLDPPRLTTLRNSLEAAAAEIRAGQAKRQPAG